MHNDYISILAMFASQFSLSVWQNAQVLITGALLARGQRTVTSVLRVMGLSSDSHFVKASGLRWLTLMLLAPIPFAQRVWALPIMTVLAPSVRYYAGGKRAAKKLTDWMRQVLLQASRWLPARTSVFVADSSYACLDLLHRTTQLCQSITIVVRFRMDAALYEPASARQPGQKGRARVKGKRLPTLLQIVLWFIQRWQLEVTHREVREHLGVETQRQWSDNAIARTTPALFGLYSLVVVLAQRLAKRGRLVARQAAWYAKPLPTFSDALAAVRQALWRQPTFHVSRSNQHIAKLPKSLFDRFADALCYSTGWPKSSSESINYRLQGEVNAHMFIEKFGALFKPLCWEL